ncbi:MAG: C1 family peptidase, partial [Rikenellaceae bacterium]|nr:C1 family peptidase [Rikenellaceae bacterium]
MKKIFLMAAMLCACVAASAQYKYEFTDVKVNPATPVKNQANTGTCWCFATVSFLESELLRTGKG